jgi:hypothetical protein
VTTRPATPFVTSNSRAISGSSASVMRIVAALANAASARNAIARVGTGSGRASGMAFAMGARR